MQNEVLLPQSTERDELALIDVLESGYWCRVEASVAKQSKLDLFEAAFAKYQDAQFGVSACNGTLSLQLALKSLGIGFSDEVVVDANAFIASASSVTEIGAVPVLTDIDPETGTIDPDEIERVITNRTKAVIVVHNNGYPADLDRILTVARKNNIYVIEDAATCVGSEWNGRKLRGNRRHWYFFFSAEKNPDRRRRRHGAHQ